MGKPPRSTPDKKQQRTLASTKYNLTDPDSGIVRHRGMLMQGYNIQTAVSEGQVILAARASSIASDGGQLAPTLARAAENLARVGVGEVISEIVADTGYWHTQQLRELQDKGVRALVPPANGKTAHPDRMQPEAQAMNALLRTPQGKATYQRRQEIIEPVFAHIKHMRGITRVLRRGKTAVQAEIDLIATTHNLLKLYRHPQSA